MDHPAASELDYLKKSIDLHREAIAMHEARISEVHRKIINECFGFMNVPNAQPTSYPRCIVRSYNKERNDVP
jgi:hypothetical protein